MEKPGEPLVWASPPAGLVLEPDEIHIWRAVLDQPDEAVHRLRSVLSPDERARADRFLSPADGRHFTVARGTLRTLLGVYRKTEPSGIALQYNAWGKPELRNSGLQFNLAHSHGRALYVFASKRRVGIDLEAIRRMPDASAIVARFFAPGERAAFAPLDESQKLAAFFWGWTCKEAFLKATGEGLALPLDGFEVSVTPGAPARLQSVGGSAAEAARWSLLDFEPWSGYAAALAVEGTQWTLSAFDFT